MNRYPKATRFLLILLMAFMLFTVFTLPGLADAGNFSGGSDYGGSDYGGSSDWGSSGSDYDWGSSYSDSDYSSSDGDGEFSIFWVIVMVVIVVIALSTARKGKKGKTGSSVRVPVPAAAGREMHLQALKDKDPNFSEQDLLDDICNHYMQMQDAWEKKDWEPMRSIMSDALYNQMARQLQEYIDKKRTNHVDNIMVQSAQIRRYAQDEYNDILTVRLSTRINDYVTDDLTGALISGSKTTDLYMVYDWTLTRSKNVQTKDKKEFTQVQCASCGAPLNVKQTGRCDYCGAIITLSEHDWVLTGIQGISRTSAK